MNEWQPIDTAPEGPRILLCWGTLDGHIEDGFMQDGMAVLFDGESLDTPPTHWMPLPEPSEAT